MLLTSTGCLYFFVSSANNPPNPPIDAEHFRPARLADLVL